MKSIQLFAFLLISYPSFSQTTIWQESFETDGEGTAWNSTSPFFDGGDDYFTRVDGGLPAISVECTYLGADGDAYWAVEDTDDNGGDSFDYKEITFQSVSTTGFSSLEFRGLFGVGRCPADLYDSNDGAVVSYSTDGGTSWTQGLKFRFDDVDSDGFNEQLGSITTIDPTCLISTANGGFGACDATEIPGGGGNIDTYLTSTLSELSFAIPGTPSDVIIRIEMSFDAGGEEFAFDNFRVLGVAPCANPDVPTLSASASTICPGETTTITIGGALNDATDWEVYSGSCGGASEGSTSSTTIDLSPTTTTTYFIRGEGGCVTPGACESITITVNGDSDPDVPTLTASSTSICSGETTTLSISGALNDATDWEVYSGSCGGASEGSTTAGSFDVSPATTTTYFIRGEGGCITPGACGSITITVNAVTDPDVPTLTASSTTICPGETTTITIGGALNDATDWEVYSGSCGGASEGSTTTGSFDVSPTTTTTYFIRGEGGCVTPGSCGSITITADDGTAPDITTCPDDQDIAVDESCELALPDFTSDAVFTDDCDGAPSIVQDPIAGTIISGAGTIQTVTLTVTDASGNSSECEFDITLVDETAPSIVDCPSDQSSAPNSAGCTAAMSWTEPTVTDNCSGAVISGSHASGDTFDQGITTVTYTATDGAGNTASCSFEIEVISDLATSATTVTESTGSDGEIDLTVTGGIAPYTFDWDNDGTGDTDDTEDLTGLEGGEYTVIVVDANGCVDTLTITVGSHVGFDQLEGVNLKMYPNPAHEMLTIQVQGSELVAVELINAIGQVNHFVGQSTDDILQIDLANFARGMYIVRVETKAGVIHRQLIVD